MLVTMGNDPSGAYVGVLRHAFRIAGATGEQCRPVHVLSALSLEHGQIGHALRALKSDAVHEAIDGPDRGGSAGYLVMQTQQAARQLAAERSEPASPGHLLLAIIDQGESEAVTLLDDAGIDVGVLRQIALQALGAPSDLPRTPMPELAPAGTMRRPPLPIEALDPRAWAALEWRQRHLPLHRVHRGSQYHALCQLESRASWRIASRLGLVDDQRYSLAVHHRDRVDQLVAQARPGLVEWQPRRNTVHQTATLVHVAVGSSCRIRRRRLRFHFPTGWRTWLSNRQVGLRNRWFRLRTVLSYRGAPPT
jgi:hypothetical protein